MHMLKMICIYYTFLSEQWLLYFQPPAFVLVSMGLKHECGSISNFFIWHFCLSSSKVQGNPRVFLSISMDQNVEPKSGFPPTNRPIWFQGKPLFSKMLMRRICLQFTGFWHHAETCTYRCSYSFINHILFRKVNPILVG